ncbi:hypothetical protein BC826DRAFT_1062954 [Russula brevipes]|nr:hypothetical protein BC826DRAFT_1062954 [Russula brevipes]
MAPLRPFPLTVSSPMFFFPASLPSDRVIPKLSLVHWQTQHPSHPAPPLQTVESFVNANVARPERSSDSSQQRGR